MRQTSGMEPARAPVLASTIDLGEFQLLIHRRQFPDALDRWDGNWLQVTAHCARSGAIVAVDGPILEASDLERFRDALATLERTHAGVAELTGAEPNIAVRVADSDGRGYLRVRVELSPDPQTHGHWFIYAIAPSSLPETIRQLDAALALFPVRGRTRADETLDPA